MMLKIQKENPYYRKAIAHESKQWGRHEPTVHMNFDENPALSAYFNQAIHVAERQDWLKEVAEKYGPFKKGCSLGCGIGKTEEQFVSDGGFESFDFFDVSAGALEKLKERLRGRAPKAQVQTFVTDLNFLDFPENSYDLILCNSILHHLINLEHVLAQIGRALKPGGLFVIRDYVGENRFQWSHAKLSMVNFFRGQSGVLAPVRRESLSDVVEASPFEAVRSQEIPALVSAFFPEPVAEARSHGFCFTYLWGVDLADPASKDKIELAVEMDRIVSKHRLLPPANLFGIYKKPKQLPALTVHPYTDAELKQMFAETLFSKRKIRGLLLSFKLGSSFYDLLRALKRLCAGSQMKSPSR